MKFQSLSVIFAYLLASSISVFGAVTEEEWIDNYFLQLRKSYDKRVAPEGSDGPGTPVKIISTMYILGIEKIDDSNMEFKAQFYFRQSWNDSRLKYSDRNENLILRDVDDIWTPDLFFVEEREGSLHHIMHPNIFCRITPVGEVLYSVRLSLTFSCPMDLRSYPHDIQKCQINIESYGFQRKHIYLKWSDVNGALSAADDMNLLEYDLVKYNYSSSEVTFSSGTYGRLEIHLTFKRKFGYFGTRLYVPFIILVLMSLLSFWVRAEEKCLRLSLLLVILYLMITIASEVNSTTPQAPYTKASDVWIAFCESLVFAAFAEFIIVALIASRSYGEDGCSSKGEILLNMDPEAKDQTTLKSPLGKLINMFDARNGGNGRRNAKAEQIDKICSIAFPIIFIIFNIVYWSVYCCS